MRHRSDDDMSQPSSRLQQADRVGFAASMLCAIHCAAMPLLLAILPTFGLGIGGWVDIDQVYSVHHDGMRREAAALDLKRFAVVADALVRRYGWAVAGK